MRRRQTWQRCERCEWQTVWKRLTAGMRSAGVRSAGVLLAVGALLPAALQPVSARADDCRRGGESRERRSDNDYPGSNMMSGRSCRSSTGTGTGYPGTSVSPSLAMARRYANGGGGTVQSPGDALLAYQNAARQAYLQRAAAVAAQKAESDRQRRDKRLATRRAQREQELERRRQRQSAASGDSPGDQTSPAPEATQRSLPLLTVSR